MGYTSSCCSKKDLNKGLWSAYEDKILSDYIRKHGERRWNHLSNKAGLNRTGKSCRLRWLNYLRPGIKRGNMSPEEEELIVRLHKLLGNRWSLIAGRLPGRTDNEVKNYWNTILRKKVQGDHSLPLPPFSSQNHFTSGSSQCEFKEEKNKQDQQSIVMRLQQPPEARQLGAEAIGEPSTIVDLKATEPESCEGLSSSFTNGEEKISSSKLTELWSSDLLNSDFSWVSHFQDGEADTNTGYNNYLDCELYMENEDDWNWIR